MADYSRELQAVRNAVLEAKELAETFQTGTARFYKPGVSTPVLECSCRVKKPRPSAFQASNATEWATKRITQIRVPIDATTGVIAKGLIVQVDTPDGDPTINHVNFVVQSALSSQFSAERTLIVVSEVNETPRVVQPAPPTPGGP